jgi:diguanylate cyclase (GGDEF)-like protein
MSDADTGAREDAARKPGPRVALVHALALVLAVVVIVATKGADAWDLAPLLVILAFSIVSALTYVETASSKINVSGSSLGIVLAAVLLGGGPAAVVGVVTDAVGWLRRREAGHYLRNNLLTYTWFPLIGGLFFHSTTELTGAASNSPGFYLLVFATFVVSLAINFLAVAGYQCYLDGCSLGEKVQGAVVPLLSAELFSVLLTMASVYIAIQLGTTGLALFGLVLVIFQYLVGELLKSKHRGDELHRMATTDELTGLANRERFRTEVQQRILAADESDATFAVMLLDLDRFKEINDTLGHHYGDELLNELGPRLAACVGPAGTIARLGGDEFAVLPDAPTDEPEALERIASELIASVQEPFLMEEMTLEIGASIGIARFPIDGEDAHALLRRADIAMYAAKEAHTDCKFYAAEFDHHSMRRLSVLSDFRRALEAGEITVYYQPILDVAGSRVCAAEGLLRWIHPELGVIPAGDFIETVEQSGLIGPLTRHVLERAIAQCAAWRRAGRYVSVAINLSVRNLLDRTLPREIETLLNTYGLPAEALQLEITESMLMSDPERSLATVTRLSELGARISVDDFGTGYSSLANLRRLPIDELKIDRSFVSPMLHDESDLIIVRSTINLAHDLGLRVVAEGVEDEPTLRSLARLGCDLVQGYHLGRPMCPEDISSWLDATAPAAAVAI